MVHILRVFTGKSMFMNCLRKRDCSCILYITLWCILMCSILNVKNIAHLRDSRYTLVVFRFCAQTELGSFSNSVASALTLCALTFHSWGLQATVWDLLYYSAPHKQMGWLESISLRRSWKRKLLNQWKILQSRSERQKELGLDSTFYSFVENLTLIHGQ